MSVPQTFTLLLQNPMFVETTSFSIYLQTLSSNEVLEYQIIPNLQTAQVSLTSLSINLGWGLAISASSNIFGLYRSVSRPVYNTIKFNFRPGFPLQAVKYMVQLKLGR